MLIPGWDAEDGITRAGPNPGVLFLPLVWIGSGGGAGGAGLGEAGGARLVEGGGEWAGLYQDVVWELGGGVVEEEWFHQRGCWWSQRGVGRFSGSCS